MTSYLEKILDRIRIYTKSEKFKKRHLIKQTAPSVFHDKKIRVSTIVFYVICHVKTHCPFPLRKLLHENYEERFGAPVMLRARSKMSHEAFRELLAAISEDFPVDHRFKSWQLLTLEGIETALPHIITPDKRFYPVAMYDMYNRFYLCASFLPSSNDRYQEIISMIQNLPPHVKQLILLDKGFHSLMLLRCLEDTGKKYLIRASKSFLKEVNGFRSGDLTEAVLTIHYTKRRAHDAKLKCEMEFPYDFRLRCLKIQDAEKEPEILITNVSSREATIEELRGLFELRWLSGDNCNYMRKLLDPVIFEGISENLIRQDYFASLLLRNLEIASERDSVK